MTHYADIQKRIQVSTERGRAATVAVRKSSVTQNMITNKLIVESFAECWANANRQLNNVSVKQLNVFHLVINSSMHINTCLGATKCFGCNVNLR